MGSYSSFSATAVRYASPMACSATWIETCGPTILRTTLSGTLPGRNPFRFIWARSRLSAASIWGWRSSAGTVTSRT